MNNKQAINLLKNLRKSAVMRDGDVVALDMAIKALSQEPCEDAISRQAVLSMQYRIDDSTSLSTRDVVNVDDIEDLPPVTPKMAKWESYDKRIKLWDESIILGVRCSKCKTDARLKLSVLLRNGPPCYRHKLEKGDYELTNYCPNCGEKMIEPQESEEV